MNSPLMALLRLIHIIAGIFWLGATLTIVGFLLPTLRETGPRTALLIRQLMQRHRLQLWINVAMLLTILAGFALYGIDSAMSGGSFARSRMGKVFGIGALFAIIAAGVAGAMSQPAVRKLGALSQRLAESQQRGAASSADIADAEALQSRLARGLTIGSVLLLLSAALMAIARYV